jgi:hypothetical protein
MAADPIVNLKRVLDDGSIVQIRIWRLPRRSPERPHGLKYSLFYGLASQRIVGYDNEAGKGDHRHYHHEESSYRFVSLEKLIEDFWSDVSRERRKKR